MLVFDLDTLNHALLAGAGVIDAHLLAGPERSGYDLARAIDDARGRPESEAHRTFTLTLHHNGFAGCVSGHRAGFICGGRLGRCRRGRSGCRCLFSCSCACLRERHGGDQRTSDCDNAFIHNPFPDLLLDFASTPTAQA